MSEKSTDVVSGLITKRGTSGRHTYSVAGKRALAELCKGPGVSVARMALTYGINANLLRRWVVQYTDNPKSSVGTTSAKSAAAVLVPVTTPMPRAMRPSARLDSCIEITFAGATLRVRGAVDARVLGVVLDCLALRT